MTKMTKLYINILKQLGFEHTGYGIWAHSEKSLKIADRGNGTYCSNNKTLNFADLLKYLISYFEDDALKPHYAGYRIRLGDYKITIHKRGLRYDWKQDGHNREKHFVLISKGLASLDSVLLSR